jgi:hypothetical protein
MSQKALLFCFAALMQASKSKSRNKLPAHVTFRRKSCSSHEKSAVWRRLSWRSGAAKRASRRTKGR